MHVKGVEALPDEPGEVVVDGGGRVRFASARGTEWMTVPGLACELAAVVCALDEEGRTSAEVSVASGAVQVSLRMLRGPSGTDVYLATVRSSAPPSRWRGAVSPREAQVAEALVAGMTIRQTAAKLGIEPDTAKEYRRSLYRKLGASSAAQAAARWAMMGA